MHAGEAGGQENVKMAVQEYGATRIGHGYRIAHDSKFMEDMRGIHFEICPTSSVETGDWVYKMRNWNEYPAVKMIRSGMNVGFNSDDPAGNIIAHIFQRTIIFPTHGSINSTLALSSFLLVYRLVSF